MTSYSLHDSPGYYLSLTARLQERRLDTGLKTEGLTRTTWCTLLAVGVEGLTRPSEIAAFIGIDRTATSRALRQMEAEGLIRRDEGTGDRRTTRVSLTEDGRRRLKSAQPVAEENRKALIEKLGEERSRLLLHLLRQLAEGEPADLPRF